MAAAKNGDGSSVLVSGRVKPEVEKRLTRVASEMSNRSGGANITSSAALGVALDRGLSVLEQEFGIAKGKSSKVA